MSNSVRIRRRSSLPGAGFDIAGNPSQNKQQVVGKIVVTDYTRGGETLRPRDLGLENFDHLHLSLDEGQGGASGQVRTVVYAAAAQQFYVLIEGAGGEFDQEAATADPVVSFIAEGDAVSRPELL